MSTEEARTKGKNTVKTTDEEGWTAVNRRLRRTPVAVFWDFNQIPVTKIGEELCVNIHQALCKVDDDYYISDFKVYGKKTDIHVVPWVEWFDAPERASLCKNCHSKALSGCSMTKINKDDYIAELEPPDLIMTRHIFNFARHAKKKNENPHFLLVTGDPDFENMIRGLQTRGFPTMLAKPKDSKIENNNTAFSNVWYVDQLIAGAAPIPRRV